MPSTKDLVKLVKEVRERTGAGVVEIKDALSEMEWNVDAAVDLIESKVKRKPAKEVGYAAIFHYNHNNRIAALLTLGCNTDFVGKMAEFKELGTSLAQQVVGADPASVEDLLEQQFVKSPDVKIKDLIADLSRKTQEDVTVLQFHREQTQYS